MSTVASVMIMVIYCMVYVFFFFQAEDGIRDGTVTGVQTCALPISYNRSRGFLALGAQCCYANSCATGTAEPPNSGRHRPRSEERRVGKECRSRWSPDH